MPFKYFNREIPIGKDSPIKIDVIGDNNYSLRVDDFPVNNEGKYRVKSVGEDFETDYVVSEDIEIDIKNNSINQYRAKTVSKKDQVSPYQKIWFYAESDEIKENLKPIVKHYSELSIYDIMGNGVMGSMPKGYDGTYSLDNNIKEQLNL